MALTETMTIETQVEIVTRTTVTLTKKQYEPLLRKAVNAPDDAQVEIEETYGGDITITWTTTEYRDGA
jgi:hypothetical protein